MPDIVLCVLKYLFRPPEKQEDEREEQIFEDAEDDVGHAGLRLAPRPATFAEALTLLGGGRATPSVLSVVGPVLELRRPEADPVAPSQPPLLHQGFVDKRAVGRPEVDDPPAVGPLAEQSVAPRDVGILQRDLAGLETADRH